MEKKISGRARWFREPGNLDSIVLFSRITLNRNFSGYPFPHLMTEEERLELWETLSDGLLMSEKDLSDYHFLQLNKLSVKDRHILREEWLIPASAVEKKAAQGLIMSPGWDLTVTLNGVNHCRIQMIVPGFDLQACHTATLDMDEAIEDVADYAFSQDMGFLTTKVNTVGTGMVIAVAVHLPSITVKGEIANITEMLDRVSYKLKPALQNQGKAAGDIYIVKNTITTGVLETEIMDNMTRTIEDLIERERTAGKELMAEDRSAVEDRTRRALGLALYARKVEFSEAMDLASMIKLGEELEILDVKVDRFKSLPVVLSDHHSRRSTMQEANRGLDMNSYRAKALRKRIKKK